MAKELTADVQQRLAELGARQAKEPKAAAKSKEILARRRGAFRATAVPALPSLRLPRAKPLQRATPLPRATTLPRATPLPVTPAQAIAPVRPIPSRPVTPLQERGLAKAKIIKADRITPPPPSSRIPQAKPLTGEPNEPVFVVGKVPTDTVQKALSREEYRKRFGYARDLTQPVETESGRIGGAQGQVEILIGPSPVNHSGRLRRTGKASKHWVQFAYLVQVGKKRHLGLQFFKGFRCYYPGTTEANYFAAIAAGSGSYYAIDNITNLPYRKF